MKLDPKQLVELLAQHERAIGRLYSLYASNIPAYKRLFDDLSAQEEGHAQLLEELCTAVSEGELCCLVDRFNPMAVRTALAYVEQQIEQCRVDSHIAPKQALSVARDMENSLIESRWFEVFDGDAPRLKETLEQLARETNKHRQLVQAAWIEATGAG